MAFKDMFKDENDINEKSVVGFASFAIMCVFAIADIVTGFFGKDLVIQESKEILNVEDVIASILLVENLRIQKN